MGDPSPFIRVLAQAWLRVAALTVLAIILKETKRAH